MVVSGWMFVKSQVDLREAAVGIGIGIGIGIDIEIGIVLTVTNPIVNRLADRRR